MAGGENWTWFDKKFLFIFDDDILRQIDKLVLRQICVDVEQNIGGWIDQDKTIIAAFDVGGVVVSSQRSDLYVGRRRSI